MSRDAALREAQELRTALLDHGVRAVSIELQQGRPGTPNGAWLDSRFLVPTSHHIVSRRSQGLTPGLALVKRGRPDVPGPLCNLYGGFDETSRILCMGWANHPGAGGPLTVRGFRIPQDNGRPYLMGTEFEGGVDAADWTDSFREFMGRHNAGVTDYLGASPNDHIEHKTWAPGRKIDRLGYTTASGRAEVARWYGTASTPPEDDEMTPGQLLAALQNPAVAQELKNITAGAWAGPTIPLRLHQHLDAYFLSRLDPADFTPDQMHAVKVAFASVAWHQILGRNNGQDGRPLVNMHTVMGEMHVLAATLPDLIAEAGDEIGLTPEQTEALASAVAEKVERVTVVVDEG